MFDINTKTSDYISIVLTHECTRACAFCIDKYRGNGMVLTKEHLIDALEFAKSHNIKDVLLTGGEPTLHPNVIEFAKIVKSYGFRLIMTSNCDRPEILVALDPFVDCFNFSNYGQEMPDAKLFKHADLTITKLLYKGGIDSKKKLDTFIDKYKDSYYLKFSTMTPITDWANNNNHVHFVNCLKGEKIIIFGELPAILYKGYVIKRYDCSTDAFTPIAESYKCLANGKIGQTWKL